MRPERVAWDMGWAWAQAMGVLVCSSSPEAVCKVARRYLALHASMHQARRARELPGQAKARYAAMRTSGLAYRIPLLGLEGHSLGRLQMSSGGVCWAGRGSRRRALGPLCRRLDGVGSSSSALWMLVW